MIQKGWINEFCFNKSQVLNKKNISNYKQINMNNLYTDFIKYLKTKDNMFNLKLGDTEFNYLKRLLLATISRNLWENDTYYLIMSEEDEYIQEAINNF